MREQWQKMDNLVKMKKEIEIGGVDTTHLKKHEIKNLYSKLMLKDKDTKKNINVEVKAEKEQNYQQKIANDVDIIGLVNTINTGIDACYKKLNTKLNAWRNDKNYKNIWEANRADFIKKKAKKKE